MLKNMVISDINSEMDHVDRVVNGINIQTKYCKTAYDSIGAAFKNGKALYTNDNGTMMPIEVPRDQYNKALDLMRKRIDNGEVPGAKPGDDPSKYVKKGYLTYGQAVNVSCAGTIEGLTFDVANGVITSASATGISAVFIFAMGIWNGMSVKEAAMLSINVAVKTLGRGVDLYTITMEMMNQSFVDLALEDNVKVNA